MQFYDWTYSWISYFRTFICCVEKYSISLPKKLDIAEDPSKIKFGIKKNFIACMNAEAYKWRLDIFPHRTSKTNETLTYIYYQPSKSIMGI
jgi:hypothetical protein